MGEIAMVKKTKYAAGIEVESAFGRTDYMYIKEIAPWAYDKVNDWIKVAIQGVVNVDITDDWARQLGKVDLSRYLGAACGLLNPVHVGITVAGAVVDPRQIRALTAADIVSAAQSGVWSVGRTWALASGTDSVAAAVSNWPASYDVSDEWDRQLGQIDLYRYAGAAVGLLNPVHVGVTVSGAVVDPRDNLDLHAIAGQALTPRDWSPDLKTLSDDTVAGVLRTLEDDALDIFHTLRNQKGYSCFIITASMASGTTQFYYFANPSQSGKTAILVTHGVEADAAAPVSSNFGGATETPPSTGDLTIAPRYVGGASGVCTVRPKSVTGPPTGWATYQFSAVSTTPAWTVAQRKMVIVVPAGQGFWLFIRQLSGANGYGIGFIEWVEI